MLHLTLPLKMLGKKMRLNEGQKEDIFRKVTFLAVDKADKATYIMYN